MEKEKKLFLSYAKEDTEAVNRFYEIAVARGFDVFMDNHKIGIGTWRNQIERTISRTNVFILFLSKHVKTKIDNQSGFIENEIDYAYSISRLSSPTEFQMLPVRLDDSYRGDFRASLFQQFDLFPNFDSQAEMVISLIDKMSPIEKIEARIQTFQAAHDYANAYAGVVLIEDKTGQTDNTTLNKAKFLFNLKQFSQAIALTKSVSDKNPSIESLTLLANMLGARKRHSEMIEILERITDIEPDNKDIVRWKNSAILSLKSLDYDTEKIHTISSDGFGSVFFTEDLEHYSGDPWFGHGAKSFLKDEYSAFLDLGSIIIKDKPLAIVSNGQIYSYINAKFNCRVIKLYVENGDDIEFNAPIMDIVEI